MSDIKPQSADRASQPQTSEVSQTSEASAKGPKPARRKTRVTMPEQEPGVRIANFKEVPLGYTPEQAQEEAVRCLQCKKPFCVEGCPVNVDIPAFLHLVAEGKFAEAAQKIKETNCLPAICGRVCQQETQCEEKCIQIGRASCRERV